MEDRRETAVTVRFLNLSMEDLRCELLMVFLYEYLNARGSETRLWFPSVFRRWIALPTDSIVVDLGMIIVIVIQDSFDEIGVRFLIFENRERWWSIIFVRWEALVVIRVVEV